MKIIKHIPFNQSSLQGRELEYSSKAIKSGQIGGDQYFSKKCQNLLESVLRIPKALVTTSCTHALEMAAILLDIQPGDEVIVPSFTFVSTANAFVLRGATPIFIDVRKDTLNLDESLLGSIITEKTKAIVPVHYAGVACEMNVIQKIAERHGIAIIEDNAHGLFGKSNGQWLGSFGHLSTLSFHETKNITCGEGGALLINDHNLIERAEVIREKGTNRSKFSRGEIQKYSWVDLGSSYVMSDLLAAYLYGHLEVWEKIQLARKNLWNRYHVGLNDWSITHSALQPTVPPHCEQAWHMYYLILPTPEFRDRLIIHLKKCSITAVFHYLPLENTPFGKSFDQADCPNSNDLSKRLIRLPFYTNMSTEDQNKVIDSILNFEC